MTPLIRAPEGLQPSRTTRCSAHTTPAADFCDAVGVNRFTLSHDSVTHHRPPEVSSTAFDAQPPDLPPAVLMEMGFAAFCPLAPCRRPHHPILVHRLASLLHASFTPRLATTPLRFAITSPPSGCEEDFHLQAVKHARHTKRAQAESLRQVNFSIYFQNSKSEGVNVTRFREIYLVANLWIGRKWDLSGA
jgi:hypothetical protein